MPGDCSAFAENPCRGDLTGLELVQAPLFQALYGHMVKDLITKQTVVPLKTIMHNLQLSQLWWGKADFAIRYLIMEDDFSIKILINVLEDQIYLN